MFEAHETIPAFPKQLRVVMPQQILQVANAIPTLAQICSVASCVWVSMPLKIYNCKTYKIQFVIICKLIFTAHVIKIRNDIIK